MIEEATRELLSGKGLNEAKMSAAMEEIMEGRASTPQIVAFLLALDKKGETAEEVAAAVRVMRRHALRIKASGKVILDTCGTGGDALNTFNISTCAAFVACGSGIIVAKHGNRSVSSKSGSADVLEALGINIGLSQEKIEQCLEKAGIAFLFAQNMHPAMKYAMPARREIGKRTIFNILGPLSNPAGANHQLIGVFDARWVRILAEVLAKLGSSHVLVVHGKDGLDEITTTDATAVAEYHQGAVGEYEVTPEQFGFKRAGLADIRGGSAADNARILLGVLKGEASAFRDIVVLNAAAAIYAADKAGSIQEGVGLAKQSIDSGKALKKLELLRELSAR